MFENSGSKIRVVAVIFFILGVISSMILAIWLAEVNPVFLLLLLFGPLYTYIACLFLTGFGDMIDLLGQIQTQNNKILGILNQSRPGTAVKQTTFANTTVTDKPQNIPQSAPIAVPQTESVTEPVSAEKKLLPVRVYKNSGGMIRCPVCATEQNGNRYRCFSCGQVFVNGQPGIPYWCGTCGKPGPYDENCPVCHSTKKIMNISNDE